ncbi:uncharacterized protein O3C94_011923 [Discoglossus pictus]
MEKLNETSITRFILLGITSLPQLKIPLFVIFLIFYMFSLVGNICIIIVVICDYSLHTPMYFLLSNLSFLDFFYSSATVPKMLMGLLEEDKAISFWGCIAQLHVFHLLGSTEALILMSMSYDRYVAICNPLRYHILMNQSACIQLASGCWVTGFVYSLTHTILTSRLPFCNLNMVSHFYCDIKPLLKLACVDTYINEYLVTIVSGSVALSTFLLIVISYIFIGTRILTIQSSNGRRKAFSTCSSHLIVVLLYFGTAFCTYLGPNTEDSLELDRFTAILVTVITPAINPLIYALRNKDVKAAFNKVFMGITIFCITLYPVLPGSNGSVAYLQKPKSKWEKKNNNSYKAMEKRNLTYATEFILIGLTDQQWLQMVLFIFFLSFYLLNIMGNLMIMTLVIRDRALHSPMYFLLANLSFLDICYSSVTVPKMLYGFLEENSISIKGCIAQMHFFHFLGGTEGVLLAAMAYDRYAAICHPLRYNNIMNKTVCIQLVFTSWVTGLIYSSVHSVMTSQLKFCKITVRHFFCDVKPVIKLACSDTHLNELMLITVSGFLSTSTFFLTLLSYCFISTHLLKIKSSQGRQKAFSTCSSHLTIVTMFYGTAVCTYLGPASADSIEKDRIAAILFTVVTPALNPIIYTLRNKEVKKSLKKFFGDSNVGRIAIH